MWKMLTAIVFPSDAHSVHLNSGSETTMQFFDETRESIAACPFSFSSEASAPPVPAVSGDRWRCHWRAARDVARVREKGIGNVKFWNLQVSNYLRENSTPTSNFHKNIFSRWAYYHTNKRILLRLKIITTFYLNLGMGSLAWGPSPRLP